MSDLIEIECSQMPPDKLVISQVASQSLLVRCVGSSCAVVSPAQLVAAALTLCSPAERERIKRELAGSLTADSFQRGKADGTDGTDGRHGKV